VWAMDQHNHVLCVLSSKLPAASLALDSAKGRLTSGQFDGSIAVQYVGSQPNAPSILRTSNDHSPVTAVAVLDAAAALSCSDVTLALDTQAPETAPRQTVMASGTSDGHITLWDISDDTAPKELQTLDQHADTVRALLWVEVRGQQLLVSSSFDAQIIVWKLDSEAGNLTEHTRLVDPSCAAGKAHKGAVTTLCVVGEFALPSGGAKTTAIASASEDGAVKLWDLESAKLFATVSDCGTGVCSMAYLTKPRLQSLRSEIVDGVEGWLACGLGDSSIALLDPKAVEEPLVGTIRGHDEPVQALLWLESKGVLVSGSSDATVRTWRVRSETPVVVQGEYTAGSPSSSLSAQVLSPATHNSKKTQRVTKRVAKPVAEGVPPVSPAPSTPAEPEPEPSIPARDHKQ